MAWRWVAAAGMIVVATGCGDDSGPDEAYPCADGTELEVLRADQPDADGNVASVRIIDAEGEQVGDPQRVDEATLEELVAACAEG